MEESKGNLLIVDDDLAVRTVITRKMQSSGYTCIAVSNGNEALETISTQTFDLVLLDIKMPGPSGIEVLPQIVSKYPEVGVVMITAVDDTRTAVEAMQMGACDYITKPFSLEELSTKIGHAIEKKKKDIGK